MTIYPKLILEALSLVVHPEKGVNIVELGMVEDDIRIDGMRVSFSLIFDRPNDPMISYLKKECIRVLREKVAENIEIEDNIFVKIRKKEKKAEPTLSIKNIIAVASGKGGVGKSTVTANLAVALAKMGYKVGLLDADIFGPSIPIMFGTEDARPVLSENSTEERNLIEPVEKYGVKMLSIGYFVDAKEAIVWRGAMASNALKQLIFEVDWGDLDFLLIDMPPGTSDIHISLVGMVKLTGSVIVSTPQKVALADARKGVSMFMNEKVNVPVLGIVENMAYFTPAELPENKYYIFGTGGAKKLAEELGVQLLGEIPIVQSIRECGDNGKPIAVEETVTSEAFMTVANNLVAQLQ